MAHKPTQPTHLASLNLFRGHDGSLHITISWGAAIAEEKAAGMIPYDYIDRLIKEAKDGKPG